jgi:hypothetical protein
VVDTFTFKIPSLIINELQKTNKKPTKRFGNIKIYSDLYGIRVEGIPLPQFKT